MEKILKFKYVNSDVEHRMKEFEKIRIKLKNEVLKAEKKGETSLKENKGILKSISAFFSDSPSPPKKIDEKR